MRRIRAWFLVAILAPGAAAMEFDPLEADVRDLQRAMARGAATSRELVDWYLARIERHDDDGMALNAMARIAPDARDRARALDEERRARGPRGPLHGIPVVVKDNYETADMPTTAGSALLAGFIPDRDATLVARLEDAGAVLLGKTNMHEFAYGIETVGSAFGAARNPYDPTRHPGGSSGGTAAAVAANFATFGLGSDTCGSLRNPAAHNALVSLRPTQGTTSRDGIIPLASTQDIGGPMARSVTDLAYALDALVGYDPADPQTARAVGNLPASFLDGLRPGTLAGARIGIVRDLLRSDAGDEEIARIFETAAREMEALGADLVPVSVPLLDELVHARNDGFYVLTYEFKFDINAYLAARPDAPVRSLAEIVDSGRAHPAVQPLLEASEAMSSRNLGTYLDELAKRERLRTTLLKVMADNDLDVLAYPTIRRKASRLGEPQGGSNCHLAANSGLPAITVPAGWTLDGMPAGIELLSRPWHDAELLGYAYDYEQATGHRRPPALD